MIACPCWAWLTSVFVGARANSVVTLVMATIRLTSVGL